MDVFARTTDVIHLNVGGEIIVTTRQSLTSMSTSLLAKLFKGGWKDLETNPYLDFNPALFRHLLEQLRQIKTDPSSTPFTLPRSLSPFAARAFKRMLKALGLDRSLPSTNEIVVMNVGGDRILTRRKSLDSSRSTALILLPSKRRTANDAMRHGVLVDADPWLFRHLLGQLREQRTSHPLYFRAPSAEKTKSMNRMLSYFRLNRKLLGVAIVPFSYLL